MRQLTKRDKHEFTKKELISFVALGELGDMSDVDIDMSSFKLEMSSGDGRPTQGDVVESSQGLT